MVQPQDDGLKPLTEHFRFSQRCCWDFKSSGMWHCIGGWMAADVSNDRGAKLQNRNDRALTELLELFVLQTANIWLYQHMLLTAMYVVCMSRDIPWLAEWYATVRRKVHQHQHKSLTYPSNTPRFFPFNHFSLSMTSFHLIPSTNIVWNKSRTDVRCFGLTPYSLVQNYRRFKGAYWFHHQSRFQQQDTLKRR